jgi:hydrogenase maturation protease
VPRVLIIGYGNPLRGDDGFGYQAAERLEDLIHDPDVEIHAVHQLTPELMDPLSKAGQAIFIDASTGPVPGEVRERDIDPDPSVTPTFTHHLTPEALVAGARSLFGRAARSVLITCSVTGFDCSCVLTQPVQVSLGRTVDAVLRRL